MGGDDFCKPWTLDKLLLEKAISLVVKILGREIGTILGSRVPDIHNAARNGKVDEVKQILEAHPESIQELTPGTSETPLHLAVTRGHTHVVRFLIRWIEEHPDFSYVFRLRNSHGNTALQLSTLCKNSEMIQVFLNSKLLDVNARNNSVFTTLHIVLALHYLRKINKDIDMNLRRDGFIGWLYPVDGRYHKGNHGINTHNSSVDRRYGPYHKGNDDINTHSSSIDRRDCNIQLINRLKNMILAMSFLLTATSFQLGISNSSSYGLLVEGTTKRNEAAWDMATMIILLSFIGFASSMGLTLSLINKFPFKPWPQVSLLCMFAAYIFSIKAALPQEAKVLLLVSVPVMVLAAAGRFSRLANYILFMS